MNQRNVEALAEAMLAMWEDDPMHVPSCFSSSEQCAEIAAWLTSRGVLVPSALSDDQIWRFDQVQMLPHTEEPAAMRDYLERIAKGEPS